VKLDGSLADCAFPNIDNNIAASERLRLSRFRRESFVDRNYQARSPPSRAYYCHHDENVLDLEISSGRRGRCTHGGRVRRR